MKTHIILFSCLYSSLALTIQHESANSSDKNTKEYKTELKDIRLVPVNRQETLQKPTLVRDKKADEIKNFSKSREQPKITQQNSRRDKKKFKFSTARVGNSQNVQNDTNHQNYMQKIANQLYMAQKHASLLSDYQKFILNQDPNVKNFILARSIQEKNPKPFSRQRQSGRGISSVPKRNYVTQEPVTSVNADYSKIVVVTPKVQATVQKISSPQNEHSAQATHIKYVTLAPQSLTHFAENQEPSSKVTLVPYQSSQPYTYYDLGVTHKPQVEAIQIPATVSFGVASYESFENGREDSLHHSNTKYEFMYNVKDLEKHNHFGHKESRTDKTTYGYYFVHLPDGRLETVKYWADKTGYHAEVDYQGEAKHPIDTDHKHYHNIIHPKNRLSTIKKFSNAVGIKSLL